MFVDVAGALLPRTAGRRELPHLLPGASAALLIASSAARGVVCDVKVAVATLRPRSRSHVVVWGWQPATLRPRSDSQLVERTHNP